MIYANTVSPGLRVDREMLARNCETKDSGTALGTLDGVNFGLSDSFVAKFAPNGDKLWVRKQGTARNDGTLSLAADKKGGI